jgi:threonine aldolase
VWVDFSKGLGAPFGAVLCGSEAFIAQAWAWKHRLGGAMRQAGIMAAGCLHALEHHIDRLAEDHACARLLNDGLKQLAGVKVRHDQPESNIVFFDLLDAGVEPELFLARLEERGLRIGHVGTGYRAVTHMDVTAGQVREALAILAEVLGGL